MLSAIISCGTIAGALIPEFTKVFTSTNSQHVKEVTTCSKHGGASLNIFVRLRGRQLLRLLDGLRHPRPDVLRVPAVATYTGSPIVALMPAEFQFAAPIFAFGLVAFGFLGMGPVTIAVDSYGPVTDNAQSVYELSQIESQPDIADGNRERISASSPTSRTPSTSWKRATARATPSRPPPSRC